jgi:predicted ribosome quality control (RQC) complex YloA/Tae2 family protein
MITNYHTLAALTDEWADRLRGARLVEAFSQERDELTLAVASPREEVMFRISTRSSFPYIWRAEGYNRARRNTATLLEEATKQEISGLRLAERDRILYLDLADGSSLQIMLFGPRPNVLHRDAGGTIRDAFSDADALRGLAAPEPRPAPAVPTSDALIDRWPADRKTAVQALTGAVPAFDRMLAEECLRRAGQQERAPADFGPEDLRELFAAVESVGHELASPVPRIVWERRWPVRFTLVEEPVPEGNTIEAFDSVDEAVRVFVRRRLGEMRFRSRYLPLEKALADAARGARESADRMLEELARESRADTYERWGHLLMASAGEAGGGESIEVEDLFQPGTRATIPLDPERSIVENAERYYDRARRTRQARLHAEKRLETTEEAAREAEALLERLRRIDDVKEIDRFVEAEAESLARFTRGQSGEQGGVPFRRFDLGGGFEVWVGRNARQNDELTFHHARKFDRWMHARGVAGSHAVLRVPGRNVEPPRPILERAASIAAWYSKARTSGLAPVIVTERKYVRKPKGAPPGAVVVEREQVLLVEPAQGPEG